MHVDDVIMQRWVLATRSTDPRYGSLDVISAVSVVGQLRLRCSPPESPVAVYYWFTISSSCPSTSHRKPDGRCIAITTFLRRRRGWDRLRDRYWLDVRCQRFQRRDGFKREFGPARQHPPQSRRNHSLAHEARCFRFAEDYHELRTVRLGDDSLLRQTEQTNPTSTTLW